MIFIIIIKHARPLGIEHLRTGETSSREPFSFERFIRHVLVRLARSICKHSSRFC